MQGIINTNMVMLW